MGIERISIWVSSVAGAIAAILGALKGWSLLKKPDKFPPPILPLNRKPRILIIDDDAKDLEQSRITLNGDYELWTHRRPFRALADIALEYDQGRAFDLIIIDFMMSPVNGARLAQTIKLWEIETSLRSPMVFFTRMGKLLDKPAGVVAVFRKPEDHLNLAQKVREIVGR